MKTKHYTLVSLAVFSLFLIALPVVRGQKMQSMTPGGEPGGVVFHSHHLEESTRHFNGKPSYRFSLEIKPTDEIPRVIGAKLDVIDKSGNFVSDCEWTSFSGRLLIKFRVTPDCVERSECGITLQYDDGKSTGHIFRLKDYVEHKSDSEQKNSPDKK